MTKNIDQQKLIINDIKLTVPPQSISIRGVDTEIASPSIAGYPQITPTNHGKTMCSISIVFPFSSTEINNLKVQAVNDFHKLMSELYTMPFAFIYNDFILKETSNDKYWGFATIGIEQAQLTITDLKISLKITGTVINNDSLFPFKSCIFVQSKEAKTIAKNIGIKVTDALPFFCDFKKYHGNCLYGSWDKQKKDAFIGFPLPKNDESDKSIIDISDKRKRKTFKEAPTGKRETVKVTKVIDGDTIIIRNRENEEETIRIQDIDAPEHDQAIVGPIATATLKTLLYTGEVTIQRYGKKSYGRTIAKLYDPKTKEDISKKMVEMGAAYAGIYAAVDNKIKEAEDKAKRNKSGVWKDPNTTKPWVFRNIKINKIPLYTNTRVVDSYIFVISHNNTYHHIPGSTFSLMQNIGAPTVHLYINMTSNEFSDAKNASAEIMKNWILYKEKMLERGQVKYADRISIEDSPISGLNLKKFYAMDILINTTNNPGARTMQIKLLHDSHSMGDFLTYEPGPYQYSEYNFTGDDALRNATKDLKKIFLDTQFSKNREEKEMVGKIAKTFSTSILSKSFGTPGAEDRSQALLTLHNDNGNIFMAGRLLLDLIENSDNKDCYMPLVTQAIQEINKLKYGNKTNNKTKSSGTPGMKTSLLPHIMKGAPMAEVDFIIDKKKIHDIIDKIHNSKNDFMQKLTGNSNFDYSVSGLYDTPMKKEILNTKDTVLGKEQMVKWDWKKRMIGAGGIIGANRKNISTAPSIGTKQENPTHQKKPEKMNPPKAYTQKYDIGTAHEVVNETFENGAKKQLGDMFRNMFPSYKFYFIKDNTFGDEKNAYSKLDSYFTTQRIMGMSIEKDKESPMDLLTVYIYDPILSSMYTQSTERVGAGERLTQNIKNAIPISPGAKVSLLLGTGNLSTNQHLVFNGTVVSAGAGVDKSSLTSSSGMTIVCRGYGAELLQYPDEKIGKDLVPTFDNIFEFAAGILSDPKLKHFGVWDEKNIDSQTGPMREWSYTGHPGDDNIFSPIISGLGKQEGLIFDDKDIDTYYYAGQNYYEIFHELTYKFPGYIFSVVPYGDRVTAYFGPRFGKYFYRPPTSSEAMYEHEFEKGKISYFDNLFGEVDFQKIAGNNSYLPMEPFANIYVAFSKINLIANNMFSSNENVYNKVKVKYHSELKSEADVVQVIFNDGNELEVKIDDAIEDDFIKEVEIPAVNCFSEDMARNYAQAYLCENVAKAYSGKIIITFCPQIKPYDVLYIGDDVNDMYGAVEVRKITHIIDPQLGAVSVITPGMFAVPNDSYSADIVKFFDSDITPIRTANRTFSNIVKYAIDKYVDSYVGLTGLFGDIKYPNNAIFALYNYSRIPAFIYPVTFRGVPLIHGLGAAGNIAPIFIHVKKILKDWNDFKTFFKKIFSAQSPLGAWGRMYVDKWNNTLSRWRP